MCNDKTKKCNKSAYAFWFSLFALVLCLLVFCLWIFETIPHSVVSPDVFIGSCMGVVSIIVTLAIGWQIFNAVEVKNTMNELKGKQEEVEKQKDELKEEIRKVKGLAEDNEKLAIYLHTRGMALQARMLNRKDIIFLESHMSLAQMANFNDLNIDEINNCLDDLSNTLKSINGNIELTNKIKTGFDGTVKDIRESKCYPWIKKNYEDIVTEFLSRVEIKEE